nr:MAG TPA: hypothetical protein [Caudoviricetes sp.]
MICQQFFPSLGPKITVASGSDQIYVSYNGLQKAVIFSSVFRH